MVRAIELFYIFFQGVVIFQAVIFGVMYILTLKKDVLFYALFLFSVAAYFFINAPYTFFGIPEENVWNSRWYEYVNTPVIIIYTIFYILFHRAFFADLTHNIVVKKALQYALLLMPFFFLLFCISGFLETGKQFIYYSVKLITIFPASILAYAVIKQKPPFYKLIAAGLMCVIVGSALTIWMDYLYSEGLGTSVFATTYPFFFIKLGLLAEMLVYLIALIKKWNFQERQLAVQEVQSQLALKNIQNEISKQLHDDVGSALSGIQLYSFMALKQLSNKDADAVKTSLETINNASLNALESLKDIVWFNNHEKVSIETLFEKLSDYTLLMTKPVGIHPSLNFSSQNDKEMLEGHTAGHLYLICKEAINNLVKYSEAKQLLFNINIEEKSGIYLTIKDDGKGFDDAVPQGFGIASMKKRASEINAELKIVSKAGEGTAINLYPVNHKKITSS